MRRRLRAAASLHNDYVFGMSDSGAMDEARLLEMLRADCPDGVTEIYLHPARRVRRRDRARMSGYRHRDELAALLQPEGARGGRRLRRATAAASASWLRLRRQRHAA